MRISSFLNFNSLWFKHRFNASFLKDRQPLDGLLVFLLIIICAVANIPYFSKQYFPVHDTLSVYQGFHYFYSQLVLAGEMPRWLPYSFYGMPSDSYILFTFGPFQYLAMAMGEAFNIQNALHLFSFSLFLDHLFLLFGAYLFCRAIFRDRFATAFTVIFVTLLTLYDRQIYWNFKLLLPVPLALFLTHVAVAKKNIVYFIMGVCVLLAWSFGSIPYVLPIQFYTIFFYGIFSLTLTSFVFPRSKEQFFSKSKDLFYKIVAPLKQPLVLLSFAFTSFLILIHILIMFFIRSTMTTEMSYNAVGRGGGFQVDLNTFLTYGGNTGIDKVFEFIKGTPTSHPHDILTYIGVILCGFLFYSFFYLRKNKKMLALLLTAISILLFSLPVTGVSHLFYILPGVSMVRHIGYFATLAKLLFVFLSGYGLLYLKNEILDNNKWWIFLLPAGLVIFLVPFDMRDLFSSHVYLFMSLTVSLVLIYMAYPFNRKFFAATLVLLGVVDVVGYRAVLFKKADLFLVEFKDEFKDVRPGGYREIRQKTSSYPEWKKYALKPMSHYAINDSYLGIDTCGGARQDLISSSVKDLIDYHCTDQNNLFRETGFFLKSIGCHQSKMFLTNKAIFVKTKEEAGASMCSQNDRIQTPVIIHQGLDQNLKTHTPLFYQEIPKENVKKFTSNNVVVELNNPTQEDVWFIYLDAYNENWHALLNSAPSKIYRANVAFKGIKIPPGKHHLSLEFRGRRAFAQKSFRLIQLLMACAVLLFLLILSVPWGMSQWFPRIERR